jgi:hypothetical protein
MEKFQREITFLSNLKICLSGLLLCMQPNIYVMYITLIITTNFYNVYYVLGTMAKVFTKFISFS